MSFVGNGNLKNITVTIRYTVGKKTLNNYKKEKKNNHGKVFRWKRKTLKIHF